MDRELRKKLKLPLKKDIVYHPNRHTEDTIKVKDIRIVKEYETFCDLEITLITGERVNIHSGYLENMQSPIFVDNMKRQDRNGDVWVD